MSALRRALGSGRGGEPLYRDRAAAGLPLRRRACARVTPRASDDALDALIAPHRAWVEGRAALESLAADRIDRRGAGRVRDACSQRRPTTPPPTSAWPTPARCSFEMTRADPDAGRSTSLAAAAQPRARGLPPRSAVAARRGRRSGFVLDRTGARRGRGGGARRGPCRSSPTTGGTISGWRSSAGARRGCARRAARWRCCPACRWRTGWRPRCTSRGRRSTRPSASCAPGCAVDAGQPGGGRAGSPASRSSGCSA